MNDDYSVMLCVNGAWTADGQLLAAAEAENAAMREELARLRLTEEERCAVRAAVAEFAALAEEFESAAGARHAATLRGLLERLK